jgi:hypothetical protein
LHVRNILFVRVGKISFFRVGKIYFVRAGNILFVRVRFISFVRVGEISFVRVVTFSSFSDGVLRVDEIKLTRESSPLPPAPHNVKYFSVRRCAKVFFALMCEAI